MSPCLRFAVSPPCLGLCLRVFCVSLCVSLTVTWQYPVPMLMKQFAMNHDNYTV